MFAGSEPEKLAINSKKVYMKLYPPVPRIYKTHHLL